MSCSRTRHLLTVLLLALSTGCFLPDPVPRTPDGGDGGVVDDPDAGDAGDADDAGGIDGGDGGTDGGDGGSDAGPFCDDPPRTGCVGTGVYTHRLDGGVFDYVGDCVAPQLNPTLGGNCCDPMTEQCDYSGGFACAMPGATTGSLPCCFDLCDGGVPCDCRLSGSCSCSGPACQSVNQSYVCPIIGSSAP